VAAGGTAARRETGEGIVESRKISLLKKRRRARRRRRRKGEVRFVLPKTTYPVHKYRGTSIAHGT
jgi:hypothetical protein